MRHVPVLLQTVLQQLQLRPGDSVIDATLGGGGHARAMLEATAPDGQLLGIEADPRTLARTTDELKNYNKRFTFIQGNFDRLQAYVSQCHFPPARAIFFDLGLSSLALDDPHRGFSFQALGPLDMRFDPEAQTTTAADIVNTWTAPQLTDLFRRLGEESAAGRIAEHLILKRKIKPFQTTIELADAIAEVHPRRGRLHPATKVFQALRMQVNDELGVLTRALPQAVAALATGGRLAVITFHSIEDRVVKHWMKNAAASGWGTIVNKHVIVPERAEQLANPRARSAKLRLFEKISSPSANE